MKSRLVLYGSALVVFVLAVFYCTFPLSLHMGSLISGTGDEIVIAWIQNWVIHALVTNPLQLFNANIYYPFPNTLAYSDAFLTSSALAMLPLYLFQEPVVVFNFTFISSLIMLGFSTFLLTFFLTKQYAVSLLSGILLIFSPAVLDKRVHVQVLAIQWVPLAMLFFFLFLERKNTWFLMVSLLFFLLQTYNSFLPGYFILFFYLIAVLYACWRKKSTIRAVFVKKNILVTLMAFLFLAPVVIPYYQVSKQFSYTRDIRDAIHYGLHPEDLVVPNDDSRLQHFMLTLFHQSNLPPSAEVKNGYIGFVFSLLVLFVLYKGIKKLKKQTFHFHVLLLTGMVGLITSLGPALHLFRKTIHHPFPIILPYALFYYVLPGFQGFRNSARFEMLFVLCSAVCIGIFLTQVIKKLPPVRKYIILSLLLVGVVAEFRFPMRFIKAPQVKEFPRVYTWLQTTPSDTAIIEMPTYNWYMAPYINQQRMRQFYSTIHFRKTVSGTSGFSPQPWQAFIEDILSDFPSESAIRKLKDKQIDYILVFTKEYDQLSKDSVVVRRKRIPSSTQVTRTLQQSSQVRLEQRFDDVLVYRIL